MVGKLHEIGEVILTPMAPQVRQIPPPTVAAQGIAQEYKVAHAGEDLHLMDKLTRPQATQPCSGEVLLSRGIPPIFLDFGESW